MSLSTFFSRARASTSNKISRLMFSLDSDVGHEPRLVQILELQRQELSVHFDAEVFTLLTPRSTPTKFFRPPIGLRSLTRARSPANRTKILALSQRTIEPWRRDFEAIVVHAFHGKYSRKMVADLHTIFDVDPCGLVDEHAQEPTAIGDFRVHEFITEARHNAV